VNLATQSAHLLVVLSHQLGGIGSPAQLRATSGRPLGLRHVRTIR
jgi:hypothetical protein